MQESYKIVEADTLPDVARCLYLLQDKGRARVDVVLLAEQHPWRLLVKVTARPLAVPYVIAQGKSAELLATQVNMLYSEGYRPIGGIITAGMFLYQAMMAP